MKRPLLFLVLFLLSLSPNPSWADMMSEFRTPTVSVGSTYKNPTESMVKTPSGGFFTLPQGWFVTAKGGGTFLQDPDKQISMLVMEGKETEAIDAIETAWGVFDPDFSYYFRTIRHLKESLLEADGWEDDYSVSYFISSPTDIRMPDETKRAWARAKKRGNIWYVQLMEGEVAALDRRSAQMRIISGSLRGPGVAPQTVEVGLPDKLDPKLLKTFEEFVEQAREKCRVPGAAFAIIWNGKVAYEKGLGTREQGKKEPVTPQTLFSVASITKPLTTLLMARLVDAGKLTWDTPVTQLWPGFQLANTRMAKNLTLKYTVCACSGLPRQDMEMLFQSGNTSPEAVLESMRVMSPTTGFGETFQYSNIMVAAGGYIAAHALYPEKGLGPAYDEAMQTQVFNPLGMKNTTFDMRALGQREHAIPHGFTFEGEYIPESLLDNDWIVPARPAAGAWSNVEDLSKYLLMELAKGKGMDGSRVVSEVNLLKRRESQAKISAKSVYGLGLVIGEDEGVTVVGHGGSSYGFSSDMFILPDFNAGMVLLANADRAGLFTDVVRQRFFELVFGRKPEAQEDLDRTVSADRERYEVNKRQYAPNSWSLSWFNPFAGDYVNEALGKVSLKITQSGGVFETDKWSSPVAGWSRNDEARLQLAGPPLTWAEFVLKDEGGRKTMTYVTNQIKYVFEKLPEAKKTNK